MSGCEPGAFLVGEVRDGHRVLRADAVLFERLDHLEAAEHAEVAVEAAARADRVDVRPHHHRGERRVDAGADADHVADRVDRDRETEVAHPADHEVAAERGRRR